MLKDIKSPQDIKNLSIKQLNSLAAEIRETIIATVNKNGGHLASNLGVVELSIALHMVYNSPEDKIVWDVGHQCYTHKLLTGRYNDFPTLRQSGGLSGFPKSTESPHDSFDTGHASTSISAALGILAAEKIKGSHNRSVAVIGDGALTGGLAFEALSHAGQVELPLVVILNDNKMSIGSNVGGISKHLSRLSLTARYQKFRQAVDNVVQRIPFIGDFLFMLMVRFKRAVKAIFYIDNFFVDLGFEYVGPINGHNIFQLIQVIREAKNLNKPVVVHVSTKKGRGYDSAEENPSSYHAVAASGSAEIKNSFTSAFSEAILKEGILNERVAVITAAMEDGTGLANFRKKFPKRFFDVGIAEGHAVTFAAALASRSLRPVVAIYSSFFQRALDQVIHDVCLQKLPVIFALDRAGLVSDDGATHQGIYDISLFRSAPYIHMLCPAGVEELHLMLKWALEQEAPILIRYPKAECPGADPAFSLPLVKGRGEWIVRNKEKSNCCLMFTGSLYPQLMEAVSILTERGIKADLYNLRFIKPIDEDYLLEIINSYKYIVIAEEGSLYGGFGEYALGLALKGNTSASIKILALDENYTSLGKRDELLKWNKLDADSIVKTVERMQTH